MDYIGLFRLGGVYGLDRVVGLGRGKLGDVWEAQFFGVLGCVRAG